MRYGQFLGAVGATFVLVGAVAAQQAPAPFGTYQARIASDDAVARSGPSVSYYATNKLRRGDVVDVVGEERDGWLKIAPPADSFSWVQLKHLTKEKDIWIVTEDTKPLIGSTVVPTKPNVEAPLLRRGTILRSLNMTKPDQGETWLRIVPHVTEARYVTSHDVLRFEVADATPSRSGTTVLATPVSRANSDHSTFSPNTYQTVPSGSLVMSSQPFNGTAAPAANTAQLCAPAPMQSPQGVCAPAGPVSQWSGVGKLLPSGYYIDGKKAYRLNDRWNRLAMYVTAGPNVDLDPLVYRNVDVHGSLGYRGEYRANCMNADTVVPAP